jgi:Cu+-exporting ATPase
MHPEIVSDTPAPARMRHGAGTGDHGAGDISDVANPELVDMTRRFWVGVAFGGPFFRWRWATWRVVERCRIASGWGGEPFRWRWRRRSSCGGGAVLHRMWQSFIHRSPNMFTLIGHSVGAGTHSGSRR